MSTPENHQHSLNRAVYKILRALVRFLMRQGVSYHAFADLARRAYIDVAEDDFALGGKKSNNARTAVLTGINRKDVAKLKEFPHPLSILDPQPTTPRGRIIKAWLKDAKFHNALGEPYPLLLEPASPEQPSFPELVKKYTSDITPRAMLDELLRVGDVKCEEQYVHLLSCAYIAVNDLSESLRIFGLAASDLLTTLDHNVDGKSASPFLQRTVSYYDVPYELLNEIRERSKSEGASFLIKINEWLAKCDRGQNAKLQGSGKFRAGIGIYYLEHSEEE